MVAQKIRQIRCRQLDAKNTSIPRSICEDWIPTLLNRPMTSPGFPKSGADSATKLRSSRFTSEASVHQIEYRITASRDRLSCTDGSPRRKIVVGRFELLSAEYLSDDLLERRYQATALLLIHFCGTQISQERGAEDVPRFSGSLIFCCCESRLKHRSCTTRISPYLGHGVQPVILPESFYELSLADRYVSSPDCKRTAPTHFRA